MPRITVDGQQYEVNEGENLLQACLSHGLDLPYFCWHPAMGSVGACRQCAVISYQDENDKRGRLTMACMTPVADGARIDIKATQAEEFRSSVIEWLMENHPHDCPVCEEGGECHLQDMTVMTGHTHRQYRGAKRTFDNQYLGPFINHEMNRCITCYRCVRFYKDYAGGTDLGAFGSRARMYFGRAEPGVLDSEFSGNLVEVCPTGVFTDKPFSQMYSRKWDLRSAPSICTGCSLGCNTFASERYGLLKRIHNRYHADVNRYFICDRGRFGMTYTNSDARIRHTGVRTQPGVFQQLTTNDATTQAAAMLDSGRTIGIGSPRASLEANYALKKLVGAENYCSGLSDNEEQLMQVVGELAASDTPTLAEIENADAVLILGEDVLNTAPRLALALRQATRNLSHDMADVAGIPQWQDAGVRGHAQQAQNPAFIASLLPTRLDDIATKTIHSTPQQLARYGFEIAHLINAELDHIDGLSEAELDFIRAAATALGGAQRPLIVSGVSLQQKGLLEAAGNIVQALVGGGVQARMVVAGSECNSFGVNQLAPALPMQAALQTLIEQQATTLVVLENDLFRRCDADTVNKALAAANVIVIDSLDNPTASLANLVFPAATAVEATGTLVNYEGRAQRHYQVFEPADEVQPAWRWLVDIAQVSGQDQLGWSHVDDVLNELEGQPGFAGLRQVAPAAQYRNWVGQKVARATHRYSGRTAMFANKTMHEPKTTVDDETPFSYSMEGQITHQPSAITPYVWSPGWNSNQSLFKFQQQVGGSLNGGEAGVHLPAAKNYVARTYAAPDPSHRDTDGKFALVVAPALFGSEELSASAQAVQQRMPVAFIVLHPDDAETIGVNQGDGVNCSGCSLEVRTDSAMGRGVAGVPIGLPGAPQWLPDNAVSLSRDEQFVRRPTIIARG